MKKIITIILFSISIFVLLFKITEYYISEYLYKWYVLIPFILTGLFLSIWSSTLIILLKPIRLILYLIFYILYFFTDTFNFINIITIIIITIIILVFEKLDFNNSIGESGLKITNLKILEKEKLQYFTSDIYHFKVAFDLKLGIRFDMIGTLINNTKEELFENDILNILSKIKKEELLSKIEKNNYSEKRLTGFEKEYKNNEIKFTLEITGKKEFIEKLIIESK